MNLKNKIKKTELDNAIRVCKQCRLHVLDVNIHGKGPGYGKLSGVGSIPAGIMLVGQNPSICRFAKSTGAFRGKTSGDFLEKAIKEAELENYYITNAVKCSTPDNKEPFGISISKCWPWLEKEIELVRPAFVVCMGAFAARAFRIRFKGKIEKKRIAGVDVKVWSIYHPAYFAKQQDGYKDLVKALKNVVAIYEKIRDNPGGGRQVRQVDLKRFVQ